MWDKGYIETSSSFVSCDYTVDGSRKWVYAFCGSAIAVNTPVYTLPMGSGLMATALAASTYGVVGVPKDAVASGSWGWFQIEGKCSDIQCAAAGVTASAAEALYWAHTGLRATTVAYTGLDREVGKLLATYSGSTTVTAFLTGHYATPAA